MRFRAARAIVGLLLLGLLLAGGPLGAAAHARPTRPPLRWSAPHLADHTAPFAEPTSVSGIAWLTGLDYLAVGGAGTVVHIDDTTRAVQTGIDGGATLTNIACPSTSLCVITTPSALLVSTDPTAAMARWTPTTVPLGSDQYSGITCASATLCVAWTDSGTIHVSTDPTGGASAWRAQTLAAPDVFAVACVPGSTTCVASLEATGTTSADFAVSRNPAAGATSWTSSAAPAGLDPAKTLACPSTALCAGTTDIGQIVTSTDPLDGGGTWSATQVGNRGGSGFVGITCPGVATCVAPFGNGSLVQFGVAPDGELATAFSGVLDPAGFGTADVNEIACSPPDPVPVTTRCLIPDRTPGIASVLLGAGPPEGATVTSELGGFTRITGLACPATSLCVGVDSAGGIVHSSAPARQTAPWARTLQSGASAGLGAVSCPTTRFCAAVGAGDTVETTPHPGTATQWTHTQLPFTYGDPEGGPNQRYDLISVSCPSFRFCLAGNSEYGLMASTHPAGGARTWRFIKLAAFNADLWVSVSCPTSSFCVAGDGNFGRIAVSSHPLRSGRAWHLFRIAPGVGSLAGAISAVSCPSSRFCLAGDSHGSVHWSTDPNGGPGAWHAARIDHHRIIASRCRSERFCVVLDGSDRAFASTDPRGGARTWRAVTLTTGAVTLGNAAERNLTTLACAPHHLCLAGSGVGAVFPGATG